MIDWTAQGRFFIDITEDGCPCGCLYCYVKTIHHDEILLGEDETAKLPLQLMRHPKFVPGPYGTLLAFGAHCDLFRSSVLFRRFLSALRVVAPLGDVERGPFSSRVVRSGRVPGGGTELQERTATQDRDNLDKHEKQPSFAVSATAHRIAPHLQSSRHTACGCCGTRGIILRPVIPHLSPRRRSIILRCPLDRRLTGRRGRASAVTPLTVSVSGKMVARSPPGLPRWRKGLGTREAVSNAGH